MKQDRQAARPAQEDGIRQRSQAPIYLDFNATTPIAPEVADAMLPYLYEHFGNPSSAHPLGAAAKLAVERARIQVARLIGAHPEEILLTSGGSESNNTTIKGVAAALKSRGRHIITSAVEHPAVLEPCRALEADGYQITILPVDSAGRVDPEDVARALTPETILVTIMHANNEVGTIQPIARIVDIAHRQGALVHTDAAQSVGKIPVRVDDLGIDFLTIAGHKLYAPKGVGALYMRSGIRLPQLIHGAAHELGRRAGTENVLGIVGLGKACELCAERLDGTMAHCRAMRDRLWHGLEQGLDSLRRNGDPDEGLPNTLSVSFRGIDAATLLAEIGDRVAASAGAACHAQGVTVSSVLEAMKIPLEYAMGTVRFSVGRSTTAEEIDAAVGIVVAAARRLMRNDSAPSVIESGGTIRLTRFSHGMGCACKLRPKELEQVLRALPAPVDPAILVGTATSDDAAVYRLGEDLAVVQTVDFFTPIADDPRLFGAISASNSLSDIYAMGARPLFALSIVAFPTNRLPLDVLQQILRGAADAAREAGIDIIGGHSIEDPEPKFGLAVTGIVRPDRIITNAGAHPRDALVLTKPLGTGIVAAAARRDAADPGLIDLAFRTMRSLNRAAAEVMVEEKVHACTDVTGFGLLGHLREMCAGAGLDAELDLPAVPLLEGVRELAEADIAPGATLDNLEHFSPHVSWARERSRADMLILADAQTSGGLLIAVAPERAAALVEALHARGVSAAAVIGRFLGRGAGQICI
ncbi:MAG: selenide, water dikinase SelD [Acidobacteriia bacterium]|nr:selenide, water dikinase SelD [Terriglobia bacterium]